MKQTLANYLTELQEHLIQSQLWDATPPEMSAFESTEPFCIDTMNGSQWLQWVFIPRMISLIESPHPLPKNFSLTPYYEEVFKEEENRAHLLAVLTKIDELCRDELKK